MTQRLRCKLCGGEYARLRREVTLGDPIDPNDVEHVDGTPIFGDDERRCDSCGVPDISQDAVVLGRHVRPLYIGFDLVDE